MKKILLTLLIVVVFSSITFAQGWVFKDVVINGYAIATDQGEASVNVPGFKNAYSVGVDPDGKVWAGTYYERRLSDGTTYPDRFDVITATDTLGYRPIPLFVWDPADGSVDTLTFLQFADGSVDTLAGHRGLLRAPDGNMLAACKYIVNVGDSAVGTKKALYKINYQTYEVIERYDLADDFLWARPAVDTSGFVFIGGLLGGDLTILDPDDWSLPYNSVTGIVSSVTRNIEVSPDGKNIYVAAYNGGLQNYYNADGVDGTYTLVDTVFKFFNEILIEANYVKWDPAGVLWIGTREEAALKLMWALDPADNYAIVDSTSFEWWGNTDQTDTTSGGYGQPNYLRAPRDAAFNVDGNYMYIADMYGYTIKRYEFDATLVVREGYSEIPQKFRLYQNYPNPFNPTTTIQFALEIPGTVELKIFDIQGRLVTNLVNEKMTSGTHEVNFDGSRYASGIYYYQLKMNNTVLTRRMTLVK